MPPCGRPLLSHFVIMIIVLSNRIGVPFGKLSLVLFCGLIFLSPYIFLNESLISLKFIK